jgi:hypothetical protein
VTVLVAKYAECSLGASFMRLTLFQLLGNCKLGNFNVASCSTVLPPHNIINASIGMRKQVGEVCVVNVGGGFRGFRRVASAKRPRMQFVM